MDNILVSIIIPVYNGSNFLAEAIDSALAQTYKNVEILVINDGSTDDGATERIALSYGDRIRYFSKENGGISSALNRGIKEMRGEYFSWLSHDDLYNPQKIEKQVDLIENSNDIILCSGNLIYEDKTPIHHNTKTVGAKLSGIELFKKFLNGYELNGLGFLIPKKTFDHVGFFDENMHYLQDLDLWLRIMMKDYRFICHRDLLVSTRVHKNQTTNLLSEHFDIDRGKLAKKHMKIISDEKIPKSKDWMQLYFLLFLKGNNTIGIKIAKQFLKEFNAYSLRLILNIPYYRIRYILKKMVRVAYNKVLKFKGVRGRN